MAKSADKSKYVLLADYINKAYGNPGSHTEDSPMVKYFKIILSEKQADLALNVGRNPVPAELIAPKLGRTDIQAIDEELWRLCMLPDKVSA